MLNGETSASVSMSNPKKAHRVHPVLEQSSSTNETNKPHTIVNLPENSDDRTSLSRFRQRLNSQTSVSSTSIDAAAGVIKRITTPSVNVSPDDEILPQTLFRHVSSNLTLNPFNSNPSSPPSLSTVQDSSTRTSIDNNRVQSTTTTLSTITSITYECQICLDSNECEPLSMCSHKFCFSCLEAYIKSKIQSSPAFISCPHSDCQEQIHPMDIRRFVRDETLYQRYETFMLRRVMQKNPETKWCPYTDCEFGLLVEISRKATPLDCPVCHRPFCRRCSQIWHPDIDCERAASQRADEDPTLKMLMTSNASETNIRPCPRCKTPIEKLNDGSCNHIRCAICTCEFCWLCMKEIDSLHFITPTGCTFYGKQRWSKKKTILFLLLIWILTPIVGILLLIIGVPAALIGVPIVVTRKFNRQLSKSEMNCCLRFTICLLVFLCSFFITPFLIILVILVGVPAILIFSYIYVPRRYFITNFRS